MAVPRHGASLLQVAGIPPLTAARTSTEANVARPLETDPVTDRRTAVLSFLALGILDVAALVGLLLHLV